MNRFVLGAFNVAKNFIKTRKFGSISGIVASSHVSTKTQLILQGVLAVPTLLGHGTPAEKAKKIAENSLIFWMTSGMANGTRAALWGVGLTMAPSFPSIFRGTVHGLRTGMEARSMAAVPFSYSTMPMDQAFAAMQYSRSRLSDSYQSIGSEAQFFAARYMSR